VGEDLLVCDEAQGAEEDDDRDVLTDVGHHGTDRVTLVTPRRVELNTTSQGRVSTR
jgi:hypothetical protein